MNIGINLLTMVNDYCIYDTDIQYSTQHNLNFKFVANHTDQIQCMNGVVNDFIRFGILFYHNELRSNMTRGEYDFSPGTNMYRLVCIFI